MATLTTFRMTMVLCAVGTTSLATQPGTPMQPMNSASLQRLDPTRQDTGPLSTSLLMQPIDLRMPLDFEDVYRVGGRGDRLVRFNGGLAAVFPRSTYLATGQGMQVQVPPGTVFYLGSLPAEKAVAPTVLPVTAAMQADTRAESAVSTAQVLRRSIDRDIRTQTSIRQDVTDSQAAKGIMTDEAYRGARVRALLQTAAASSQPSR